MAPVNLQGDSNIILQTILDQIKELRLDLNTNFVRKGTYDVELSGLRSDIDELKEGKSQQLSKVAIAFGLASTALTILNLLHILPR